MLAGALSSRDPSSLSSLALVSSSAWLPCPRQPRARESHARSPPSPEQVIRFCDGNAHRPPLASRGPTPPHSSRSPPSFPRINFLPSLLTPQRRFVASGRSIPLFLLSSLYALPAFLPRVNPPFLHPRSLTSFPSRPSRAPSFTPSSSLTENDSALLNRARVNVNIIVIVSMRRGCR